ncbi:MAG: type II CAAX prenyl endopeptidase Rce1 family protein [Phycisphaeraceae bacterium]
METNNPPTPPQLPPDAEPQPPQRESRGYLAVVWTLLIVLVAITAWLQWTGGRAQPDPAAAAGEVAVPPPAVDTLISGRLAVGWHHLGSRGDGPLSAAAEAVSDATADTSDTPDDDAAAEQPSEDETTAEADQAPEGTAARDEQPQAEGRTVQPDPAGQMLRDLRAAVTQAETFDLPTQVLWLRVITIEGEIAGAGIALDSIAAFRERVESPAPPLEQDLATLETIYRGEDGEAAQSDARQALVEHHGWFGKLALAYGRPPSSGLRESVIGAATRTVWTIVGVSVFLILLLVVGLLAAIGMAIALGVDWTSSRYVRPQATTGPLLETVAVFILLFLVVSFAAAAGQAMLGLPLGWLVVVATPLALFWPLLRGVGWSRLRQAMGWHRGGGAIKEVFLGLVGYVAGVPLVAAGLAVTLLLGWALGGDATHPAMQQAGAGGFWDMVLLYVLVAVWAPLVEESIFRGAFYHHLRRGWGSVASATLVGLFFAVIHPQGYLAVPVLASLGVVLALIREWRGTTIGAMTAHAVHNAGAVTILVMLVG